MAACFYPGVGSKRSVQSVKGKLAIFQPDIDINVTPCCIAIAQFIEANLNPSGGRCRTTKPAGGQPSNELFGCQTTGSHTRKIQFLAIKRQIEERRAHSMAETHREPDMRTIKPQSSVSYRNKIRACRDLSVKKESTVAAICRQQRIVSLPRPRQEASPTAPFYEQMTIEAGFLTDTE